MVVLNDTPYVITVVVVLNDTPASKASVANVSGWSKDASSSLITVSVSLVFRTLPSVMMAPFLMWLTVVLNTVVARPA